MLRKSKSIRLVINPFRSKTTSSSIKTRPRQMVRYSFLTMMFRDGEIDVEDLQWNYLQGDGDFRSTEIKNLRDEADIIITNPPFSLFRDFLGWIIEAKKQFVIIGNMNAVTYKEVFPN